MPLTTYDDRYSRTNTMSQPVERQPLSPWQTQPQPAGQQTPIFGSQTGAAPTSSPAATTQPNAMAYPAYGGGLRINPTYLPEYWNYEDSPEFKKQLELNLRGANRRLLAMGRSDSTGGANALNTVESNLRAQEVNRNLERTIANAMANYGRYTGANVENYGRTRDEDQTGWNRAAYLGEQGWNRNYQLANLGYDATRTGVQSGNAAGANLANLLAGNGANQASLALQKGAVSADQIQSLFNAGWTFLQIEQLFNGGTGGSPSGATLGGVPGMVQPTLPAYSGSGIGDPAAGQYSSATPGYDFFA
jgi:hypothetical protein